eukprot:5823022-Amphidinium_carterae.1
MSSLLLCGDAVKIVTTASLERSLLREMNSQTWKLETKRTTCFILAVLSRGVFLASLPVFPQLALPL